MKIALILLMFVSIFAGASTNPTFTTKVHKHPHAKGYKRSLHLKKNEKQVEYKSFVDATEVIPGSVDISAKVSLLEDQGQCGACWDFSLTKALRSSLMVAGQDPGRLAFNYLLDNCGTGTQEMGCNGGDFNAADNFLNGAGPWLESQDPYTQSQGLCANLPMKGTALSYQMLGDPSVGPSFQDLAYAVGVLNQTLSIDVAAGVGQWENYSDGIYNECVGGPNDIDHMINMVGYNCETSVDASGNCTFDANGNPLNGDGYLLVMNNWGETWGTQAANGHGGYMKTRFMVDGARCNAIATDALMFTVKQLPVPPAPPAPPAPAPSKAGVPLWAIILIGVGIAGLIALVVIGLLKKKALKPKASVSNLRRIG